LGVAYPRRFAGAYNGVAVFDIVSTHRRRPDDPDCVLSPRSRRDVEIIKTVETDQTVWTVFFGVRFKSDELDDLDGVFSSKVDPDQALWQAAQSLGELMRNRPALWLLASSALLAAACEQSGDEWTLFVYPAGSSGFAIVTPGFSRDMCRFAGQEAVQSHAFAPGRREMVARGDSGEPTFECGRQCRMPEGGTIAVCAESFDAGD
jgi:hypothetical protein